MFNLSEVAKTGAMVYPSGWSGGDDEDMMDDDNQQIPVANGW